MEFNIKDDYIVADIGENVVDIALRMKKNRRFNHVIILENKRPSGIVSVRDIVERVVAEGKEPNEILVSDIMTSPIVDIKENQEPKEIADIMREHNPVWGI